MIAGAASLLLAAQGADCAAQDSGPSGKSTPDSEAPYDAEHAHQLLRTYCFACHADGASEGNLALDDLMANGELLENPKQWAAILNNIRSGVMPPLGEDRPSKQEQRRLADWVHSDVYHIDPQNPDPGRVMLRRLNRVEYQNTIRDLLGYDYDVLINFPPDDTGYGFDTIGEVLTVSTMLTEKYLNAAETIVEATVPKATWQPHETIFRGEDFPDVISAALPDPMEDPKAGVGGENFTNLRGWPLSGKEIHFDEAADLRATFTAPADGHYELDMLLRIDGQFEYSPLRSQVEFMINDEVVWEEVFEFHDGEDRLYNFEHDWVAGRDYNLRFRVTPLPPAEDAPQGRPEVFIRFIVKSVTVRGPMAREAWKHPPNYDRFFTLDTPPVDAAERRAYAKEVLGRFATQAFRRPANDRTVDALVQVAETEYARAGSSFERGIGRAVTAILASPRFLYREEGTEPLADGETYPLIDEYSLASRLSYLFWSTMPDEELFQLASERRLRENLSAQVDRMLADPRSDAFIDNFVGQWLRVRDVGHVRINSRVVANRDLTDEQIAEEAKAAAEAAAQELARQQNPEAAAATDAAADERFANGEPFGGAREFPGLAPGDAPDGQRRGFRGQGQLAQGAPGEGPLGQGPLGQPGPGARGQGRAGLGPLGPGQPGLGPLGPGQPGLGQPGPGQPGQRQGQFGQGRAGQGRAGQGRPGQFAQFGRGGRGGRGGRNVEFNDVLRSAMQQETNLQFAYIMRNDRSLLELIDSDYAFLNQQLAALYEIPGVEGRQMRLVELPEDSPRGGVLTQGTLLTITSNPDRTSPVKRGLFILDNILGSPPPPPPTDVALLEEVAEQFADKTPTLREVLELHRESPECAGCHARMDPLGLALENFNALGMWRKNDVRNKVDATGRLVSGEEFQDIRELKAILKETKARDFYGCMTEKLMTYALGRGVEHTDAVTIEAIVDALDENEGRFSVLIESLVNSPQFQRRRAPAPADVASN